MVKNKVFISYASEDREVARKIHYALLEGGYETFFDKTTLKPGEGYHQKIQQAVETSDLFVFVVSNNSLSDGTYALTELMYAEKYRPHPQEFLIPVFIDKVDSEHVPGYVKAVTFLIPTGNVAAEVLSAVSDILPRNIHLPPQLAELVVDMRPFIKPCIDGVKKVAACKRIHSHLHELRHQVVRPIREEVLSMWEQDGPLNNILVRDLRRRLNVAAAMFGKIEEASKNIPSENRMLKYDIKPLLEWRERWVVIQFEQDFPPTRMDFTSSLDTFCFVVNRAFSQASRSINEEQKGLETGYLELLRRLEKVRQARDLNEDDHKQLDRELETVETNHSYVANSLNIHQEWHEAHDDLVLLESSRGADDFETLLKNFRDSEFLKMLDLVSREMVMVQVHQEGSTDTINTVAATGNRSVSIREVENGGRFVNALPQLQLHLEELIAGADADVFEKMRSKFDEAFYFIDILTEKELNKADKRVKELETWLDGLAKAQKENLGSTG